MKKTALAMLLSFALAALMPQRIWACACGCGVFDVATGTMFPGGSGGTVWLEDDHLNQTQNFSGTSKAPATDNSDKQLRSEFYSLGMQYMFNRKNGVMIDIPYTHRFFATDDGGVQGFTHAALGDIRIRGVYTGFSPDMSSGITYGLKLASGDFGYPGFDRDTAIGTGSTNLLLGGYHQGVLTTDAKWKWFVNAEVDQPFMIREGYRPGTEVDGIGGVYYRGFTVAKSQLVPIAQVIGSYRARDSGPAADPDNSGYQRLLFAPALEVHTHQLRFYAQVGLPIYQKMNGDQLVASQLLKFSVSRDF